MWFLQQKRNHCNGLIVKEIMKQGFIPLFFYLSKNAIFGRFTKIKHNDIIENKLIINALSEKKDTL